LPAISAPPAPGAGEPNTPS